MPDEAADKLEETRKLLAALSEQVEAVNAEKSVVDSEIRDEHIRLNALNSKRISIDNLKYELQSKLRDAEKLIQLQEKEAAQELEARRQREEYRLISDEFDYQLLKYEWGGKAKPHQVDGAKKLAIAKRAVLGDKRGLGKTLTAIATTDLLGSAKILAIVPNDVMGNFQREVAHWAPHRSVHIIGGYNKIQRNVMLEIFQQTPEIFVIVNYDAWRKDNNLLQQLIKVGFDTVIADEAHIIKEMGTNAYRGVETVVFAENQCPKCKTDNIEGMKYISGQGNVRYCYDCGYTKEKWNDFQSVKNIIPMTGTPILNRPQDIFPLLHLCNPIIFHDKSAFLNTYCERDIYTGKWRFTYGGEERLASRLQGIYVARNRYQAGVEIPKQSIQYHNLTLDPEIYPKQWEAYQILSKKSALVVNDMLAEEENKVGMGIFNVIALITRQRQMMTWPNGIKFIHPKTKQVLFECDVTESVKVDYICDRMGIGLIPQLVQDEEERVVVFSQFKEPLKEIERRLKEFGISVARYDGDTNAARAQEIQIDFDRKMQDPDKPHRWDVVLCHYKKGGVGLNLDAATQTILLDEEWNPGKDDQAKGRTDRMSQTEETTVHVLRVKGTVDMWMASLINEKAKMIAGFETQVDIQQELLDILRGAKEPPKEEGS